MRISFSNLLPVALLLVAPVAASSQELTVMELLQSQRQFEGRRVCVSGYYKSDFESHTLFADRAAAENFDVSRAIWVSADPYVDSALCKAHVIGVFFYARHWNPKPGFLPGGYGLPLLGGFRATLINSTVHLSR